MQRHITKSNPSVVKLLGRLCDNDDSNSDISIGNADNRLDNIATVLLALYVPWERLLILFQEAGATEQTLSSFCWNVWCKCRPMLDAYVQYYAINLIQMRKSKLEARASAETNAKARNPPDPTKDILKDEIVVDTNDGEDSFDNIGLLNDESLEMIFTAFYGPILTPWTVSVIRNLSL